MSLQNSIYNIFFRRTSTFVLTVAVSAFFFERTVELGCSEFFKKYNKGKLYADMMAATEQK